jgi:protein TonB
LWGVAHLWPQAEAPAEARAVAAPVSESAATQTGAACATDAPATPQASADAAYPHYPKPPYPSMSRRLYEEGTVSLRVHVLPDGHVDQVEIQRSSGFPRLDESARATILHWRFIPEQIDGEAIASWIIVPVQFKLE